MSIFVGFPKWGDSTPQWMACNGKSWKILFKWMIWGSPHHLGTSISVLCFHSPQELLPVLPLFTIWQHPQQLAAGRERLALWCYSGGILVVSVAVAANSRVQYNIFDTRRFFHHDAHSVQTCSNSVIPLRTPWIHRKWKAPGRFCASSHSLATRSYRQRLMEKPINVSKCAKRPLDWRVGFRGQRLDLLSINLRSIFSLYIVCILLYI